jgi:hypothetical protein
MGHLARTINNSIIASIRILGEKELWHGNLDL